MSYYLMQVVFINKKTHLILTGSSWVDEKECFEVYDTIEATNCTPEEIIVLEILNPEGQIIASKLIERDTAQNLLIFDNYDFDLSVQQAIKYRRLAGKDKERLALLDRME